MDLVRRKAILLGKLTFAAVLVLAGNLLGFGTGLIAHQALPASADQYGDPLPSGALVRFGTVRFRREATSSKSVAFTSDGQALVSARADTIIQFWDLRTGRPLQQLR